MNGTQHTHRITTTRPKLIVILVLVLISAPFKNVLSLFLSFMLTLSCLRKSNGVDDDNDDDDDDGDEMQQDDKIQQMLPNRET